MGGGGIHWILPSIQCTFPHNKARVTGTQTGASEENLTHHLLPAAGKKKKNLSVCVRGNNVVEDSVIAREPSERPASGVQTDLLPTEANMRSDVLRELQTRREGFGSEQQQFLSTTATATSIWTGDSQLVGRVPKVGR